MIRNLILVTAAFAVVGCKTSPPTPPTGVLAQEGFEAFATPRSFDGPGTIYRIDEDGKRFSVSEIIIQFHTGDEELQNFISTREISIGQLLQAIGVLAEEMPTSAKANVSSTASTTIEARSAKRHYVRDDDIEAAMLEWAANARPRERNIYYLIRETVATNSLNYRVQRDWLASFSIDAEVLKSAGFEGEAKYTDASILEIERLFDAERNVWYKAEKVTVSPSLGAAPGQYTVERIPVSGSAFGIE